MWSRKADLTASTGNEGTFIARVDEVVLILMMRTARLW